MPVNHQPPTANRQLPAAAFALLPLLWLWYVLLNDLHVEWTVNPQYGYGWAVPFLCLFLIARKMARTPAPHPAPQPLPTAKWPPPTPGSLSSLPTDRSKSFLNFSFQLSQFQLCFKRGQHRRSTPPTANCQLPTANLLLAFTFLAFLYAPTRLIQQANPGWRLVSWALAIEVVGLSLCTLRLAGSFSVRRFTIPSSAFYFPLVFFLVAVPWPTILEGPLIQALTRGDVAAACECVAWFGIPAVPHGNVIELSTGQVGVDDACSGIRSFQATLMISLFLGEFYGLAWRRRLFCVALGFLLALLLNLLRQIILIVVAARQGVSAIGKWHDPAGVVILLGCFFALWSIGKWLARKNAFPNPNAKLPDLQSIPHPPSPVLPGECQPPAFPGFSFLLSQFLLCFKREQQSDFTPPSLPLPTASCQLLTFLLPLTLWLLFVEFGVETWYRGHERHLPAAVEWQVSWPTNNASFKWRDFGADTVRILRFSDGCNATWRQEELQWQVVFLHWKPSIIAVRLAEGHTPEVCLTAAGHILSGKSELQNFNVHGLQLPFRFYQLSDTPQPVFVAYCLWSDRAGLQQFSATGLSYAKRLGSVLSGVRNTGQRSIEIMLYGVNDLPEAINSVKNLVDQILLVSQ